MLDSHNKRRDSPLHLVPQPIGATLPNAPHRHFSRLSIVALQYNTENAYSKAQRIQYRASCQLATDAVIQPIKHL